VIDHVIEEPIGGAHLNHEKAAANFKTAVLQQLDELSKKSKKLLLEERYQKFRAIGQVLEG
jgi:acetyl-CoA carboxylase carboxyl transferase subunit alpha